MSVDAVTKQSYCSPAELVSGIVRLVSLPEVCLRVNEMLEEPQVSAKEIGRVIGQDAGLTARLLKTVNSSYYGSPTRIDTVSRAVSVIGLRQLRGLVLAALAGEAFTKSSNDLLNMVNYWRHSVYSGVVAQLLAKRCHVLHSERLFVAGLLHDVGKLVISQRLPDVAQDIIARVKDEQRPDFEIERELLGYDHTDVGAELLSLWHMPASLIHVAKYHHSPQDAADFAIEVCIAHIANSMTMMAEQGQQEAVEPSIDPYAWDVIGLNESVMDEVFSEAGPMFTESLESILPRSYQYY